MEGNPTVLSSATGKVPGPYDNETIVCRYIHSSDAHGSIWLGNNPLLFNASTLFVQITLIFLLTRIVYFFIKPLRQSIMSAQIIAGIVMGPSLIGHQKSYANMLLTPQAKLVLSTAAEMGFMLHLFLLGVQIDFSMLGRARKNAVLIGTVSFICATIVGMIAVFTIGEMVMADEANSSNFFPIMNTVNSITSFPVITSLLADLNILNSDMGRIAATTSMVCDLLSYVTATTMAKVGPALSTGEWSQLWSLFWIYFYISVIVFLLKPLTHMMAKRLPEGQAMAEGQFIFIMLMVFLCGFFSEFLGQHSGLGAFIFGLVVPDGPPFGESIVYKLEAMSSGLLLPAKFVLTGLNVNLEAVKTSYAMAIEAVIMCNYLGKFLGTLFTALYCQISLSDALSLSLVMCCKGIVDIGVYSILKDEGVVDNQVYALLIITLLIVTGIARALVGYLYDPSRRYRKQLQGRRKSFCNRKGKLQMLVCVHNEANVPPILNLLEASNPSRQKVMTVIVLTLMELKGRAAAVLVPNFRRGKFDSKYVSSKTIVGAFSKYELETRGRVDFQHFTAIAPYASIHNDICTLALDKNVTIVILPFHKYWTMDGTNVATTTPLVRTVNLHVMEKAPCSVGILIDKGYLHGNSAILTGFSLLRIGLLFVGGADDREALAYATHIVKHPGVMLTVIWIRPCGRNMMELETEEDDVLDVDMMNEFRQRVAMRNKRVVFKEEMVKDGEGTLRVIHTMEDTDKIELCLAGMYHSPRSPVMLGLTEWRECAEFGILGDTLTSPDFEFSVLVIKQPEGSIFQSLY